MITMSAGMGERFASTASEFTEKIRRLGPNPVKRVEETKAVSN
jgi:coenzyme F420-reducing hydrogenase delta subunit